LSQPVTCYFLMILIPNKISTDIILLLDVGLYVNTTYDATLLKVDNLNAEMITLQHSSVMPLTLYFVKLVVDLDPEEIFLHLVNLNVCRVCYI